MRQFFGEWGIKLDDATFARAVAARIVELGHSFAGWVWSADWRGVRESWREAPWPAGITATAWPSFVAQNPEPRLIVPDLERARGEDAGFALAVLDWVSRARPAIGSVIADTTGGDAGRIDEWKWPLRVGVLPERGASQIVEQTGYKEFFGIEEIHPGQARWDLLVAPGSVRDTLAALTTRDDKLEARCILITGGHGALPPVALVSALGMLRSLVGAHAIIVARVAPNVPTPRRRDGPGASAAFLTALARALAHNGFLDVAVFVAARDQGLLPGLLLSGDPRFFDSTRPSLRLRRLADKMIAAGDTIKTTPSLKELPGFDSVVTGPVPDTRALGHVIQMQEASVQWDEERQGATGTARLARAMRPAFEEAAAMSPPRFVNAGLRAVLETGDALVWSTSLSADRTYALLVWISPNAPVSGVLALAEPIPTPVDEHETHQLEVVLNEPNLLNAPVTQTLQLPPRGDSTRCRFLLFCRPGVERLEARVIVLHRGRVLQTGVLRGAIAASGTPPDPDWPVTFELDAIPRRRLATLGSRSTFGAAVVANHTDDGTPQGVAIVGEQAARIRLGDESLRAITARFNAAISDIAAEPERYTTLRSPGTVKLLRDLAQHGASLHRALTKDNAVGPSLVKEPRVQIVTARVDAFLPLELAYRYEAPEDDAVLCEGAEDALGADPEGAADAGACAARCGPNPGGADKRICPMGFWCLFKTIERFGHKRDDINLAADYVIVAEPIGQRAEITRPSKALVAASSRAMAYDPQVVDRVVGLVQKAVGAGQRADDWKAWERNIGTDHPGLLVLIPHHVRKDGDSLLEIGADSTLKSTLVKPKHVVGNPPPDPLPKPIVLLLGCETQDATIAFENFPTAFRDGGAVIVIATIATVLGRDAGPAAEALIRRLTKVSASARSFGDVLLSARRELLGNGKVMALAIAGFGDADWRLA